MSEDSADGTTDCPICLCPIPSEPWGVVSPCGHPYHRECWDQVAANHASSATSTRGRRKNASCAVCNGATKSFVPVFLSLGNDDDGVCTSTVGKSAEGVIINIDGDEDGEDVFEKLVDEWDGLWKELETLCGFNVADENDDHVDVDGNQSDNDNSVVDVTDSSDRYVADICACIDLTQTPQPQRPSERGRAQSSQRVTDSTSTQTTEPSSSSDQAIATEMQESEMEEYQYQQKQERVVEILERLKILHIQIVSSHNQSEEITSSTPAGNNKKLQRLKSKLQKMQSTNADLTSQKQTLQNTNTDLSSQINKLRKTLSDRTMEAERTNQKYENLQSQFYSLEESYEKYVGKSKLEKSALQTKVANLQEEYTKLNNQVGLEDIHEMQEIRSKYTKMSQEVHDVKQMNAKLKEQLGRRKREWEGRLDREREKSGKLEDRLKSLLDGRDVATSDMAQCCKEAGVEEDGDVVTGRVFSSGSALEKYSKQANGGSGFAKSTAARQKMTSSTSNTIGKSDVRHQLQDKLVQDLLAREKAEAGARVYYAKPAASATRYESASSTKNSNGNMTQTKSKAMEASGRALSKKKNKAMDALDRASSRKFAMNLKRPAQQRQQHEQQNPQHRHMASQLKKSSHHNSLDSNSDERQTRDNDDTEVIELMMRTRNTSKKRPKGSSNISTSKKASNDSFTGKDNNDGETISLPSAHQQPTQRQLDRATDNKKRPSSSAAAVTASRRQAKGNIATFFKPINLDDSDG